MLYFLRVGICLQSSSQRKDMDREDCKKKKLSFGLVFQLHFFGWGCGVCGFFGMALDVTLLAFFRLLAVFFFFKLSRISGSVCGGG